MVPGGPGSEKNRFTKKKLAGRGSPGWLAGLLGAAKAENTRSGENAKACSGAQEGWLAGLPRTAKAENTRSGECAKACSGGQEQESWQAGPPGTTKAENTRSGEGAKACSGGAGRFQSTKLLPVGYKPGSPKGPAD